MIIGIAGTDGAGKGTVVDYLVQEKGFIHCSARTILTEELNKQGRGLTRNDLRLMGNEMRTKYGDDFLISYYLKKQKQNHWDNIAIESIRAIAEAEALKNNGGILVAVDANQRLRYERVQERRSSSDQVTYEEFVTHEKLEADDPDPHGMQKLKVIAMADHVILNNGTLEVLHRQIEQFLQSLNKAE